MCDTSQQLMLFPLEDGVVVRVDGYRGTFTVMGHEVDGSVLVYGGTRQQYRSFAASRVHPIKIKRTARESARRAKS